MSAIKPVAWQCLVHDTDHAPHWFWQECSEWETQNCTAAEKQRALYALSAAQLAMLEQAEGWVMVPLMDVLREVREALAPVSEYGRPGTRDVDQARLQHIVATIDRAIAAAPKPDTEAALQLCGHPNSLLLHSAETGEPLYCEACDDKSGRRDAEARESELREANRTLLEELDALRAENERLREALAKIDAIRNDIIGWQKVNWSRHIYPLVAALDDAGFPGMEYQDAREVVINAARAAQGESNG